MTTISPTKFNAHAILCDTATSAEGKLYIHGGGWGGLMSPTFPFTQSRIGVALVLDIPYTATNINHQLHITIDDEDGKPIQLALKADQAGEPQPVNGIGAVINVGRPPLVQAGESQSIPLAINIDQIRFEAPGAYTVTMTLNNELIEQLRFRVQATPAQQMTFKSA